MCVTPRQARHITYAFFFFYSYGDHRALHSFPTRRSSDLHAPGGAQLGEKPPHHPRPKNGGAVFWRVPAENSTDRKSTRLNSSHVEISYAVFCLKKKKRHHHDHRVTAQGGDPALRAHLTGH